MRDKFAVLSAKGVSLLAKLLRRGGTSLPGEVALKIAPDLPQHLLAEEEVILISGTNGKTSTMHFLAEAAEGLGYSVVANWAGANLIYGITTTILKSKARKKAEKSIYIFEIDEAHLAKYGTMLNPRHIILTNLFEDQTDRYGSVPELRERLRLGLNKLSKSVNFYLPSDDPQLALIGHSRGENCYYFGREVESDAQSFIGLCRQHGTEEVAFDSLGEQVTESCPACGSKLHYAWRSFGNHGGFCCTHCELSWSQPELGYELLEEGSGAKLYNHLPERLSSEAKKQGQTEEAVLKLGVPGTHNLVNATAALMPLLVDGHSLAELVPALKKAKAPFGRMEKFTAEGHETTMILVKNPVGLEAGLKEASKLENLGSLVLMMNKRVNDGRDDSWLSKVDYAELLPQAVIQDKMPLFICGESAAYLAQLLTAKGIKFELAEDYSTAFDKALAASPEGSKICVLPNYSAMLDFRAELVKRYNLPEFWEH